MMHVILGTKAQLIKMAPVIWSMQRRSLPLRFILTGQHSDTMEEMTEDFGLPRPDAVLYNGPDITRVGQMLHWTARLIAMAVRRRSQVFAGATRGIVLVHGDTISTVVGAMMGRCAGLHVAHVESGLRSFRLLNPFPEECNRLLTFRLSDTLFCPGPWAYSNVCHYKRKNVVDIRHNTLVDVLREARKREPRIEIPRDRFAICSVHRYENIFYRRRLSRILDLVLQAADRMTILFVLHLPTRRNLERFGLLKRLQKHQNIELRERHAYFDFVQLLARASFLFTDGGSNQEEASYLGLPCLLLRTATERQNGLSSNVVLSQLCPRRVQEFLNGFERYRISDSIDGDSPSDLIAEHLEQTARNIG